MEVASHPIHNPFRFCHRRSSICSSSPPSLLYSHKGLRLGLSPSKQTIVRTSVASNGSFSTPRKHVGVLWTCLQEEFKWPLFYYELNRRKKLQRKTVARSGLVGSGIPDSAYPLSETKLGSKVRGMCFYVVTAIAAIFLFWMMLVQHPFVLLLDRYRRKAHTLIARIWATSTVMPFLKIKYEGLVNLPSSDVPAVYVSNHQSFLDIYTLLTLGRRFKFISKTAIFLYPIIGWAMFMLGFIPLKRMDSRSQLECLKHCIELVKKGASVFLSRRDTKQRWEIRHFQERCILHCSKNWCPCCPYYPYGNWENYATWYGGYLELWICNSCGSSAGTRK